MQLGDVAEETWGQWQGGGDGANSLTGKGGGLLLCVWIYLYSLKRREVVVVNLSPITLTATPTYSRRKFCKIIF